MIWPGARNYAGSLSSPTAWSLTQCWQRLHAWGVLVTGEPDLGCFSLALHVDDLNASVTFYSTLGFEVLGGEDGWRILGNGSAKIGLFEGFTPGNSLTFNPGLAQDWEAQEGVTRPAGPGGEAGRPEPIDGFTDIRVIEQQLVDAGLVLDRRTASAQGPDHILLTDPDGNQVLIDQYFDVPASS